MKIQNKIIRSKMHGPENVFSLYLLLTLIFLLPCIETAFCQSKNKTSETVLPDAARISDKTSGKISTLYILNAQRLSLATPFDSAFQIVSFRITRVRYGKKPIEILNDKNGDFTGPIKELIGGSLPGDKLYFEYIICRNKAGEEISMKALTFIIE